MIELGFSISLNLYIYVLRLQTSKNHHKLYFFYQRYDRNTCSCTQEISKTRIWTEFSMCCILFFNPIQANSSFPINIWFVGIWIGFESLTNIKQWLQRLFNSYYTSHWICIGCCIVCINNLHRHVRFELYLTLVNRFVLNLSSYWSVLIILLHVSHRNQTFKIMFWQMQYQLEYQLKMVTIGVNRQLPLLKTGLTNESEGTEVTSIFTLIYD